MKKFTLIEEDRYISIDDIGIFFEKENWPFVDIKNLWAIQWRDNGTPEGNGWVEYDSPIPNTSCTIADLQKYIEHFNVEFDRQSELKRIKEEQDRKKALSWQEAMKELEVQMEEMQKRHEESLSLINADHEEQIKKVHERVAEAHENLFYASNMFEDNVEESKTAFQFERGYDNLTIFDGNVDPSLFDDSVDDSFFTEDNEETLLDDYSAVESDSNDKVIRDFSNLDLSVLDSEFNLELLFEEDPTEQVVNEIEELIEEVDKEEESGSK